MDKIATKEALKKVSQALNDKIAQQDYIMIPIADPQNVTAAEKVELKKAVENGTPFNCIIETTVGDKLRVISYNATSVVVYSINVGSIVEISYE